MRVPVTQQENDHGALVRDAVNELAAELRETMKQAGEDSQADKVWLALASWLRNNSMMPTARKLGNGQAVTHPVFAGGRAYVLRLERLDTGMPPRHRLILQGAGDGPTWRVESP